MINIQNINNNKCFKWCLVIHLHPADHHTGTITKADKDFLKELSFKGIKFPVKIRDIQKSKKDSVFGYENRVKYSIEGKKHYILIK